MQVFGVFLKCQRAHCMHTNKFPPKIKCLWFFLSSTALQQRSQPTVYQLFWVSTKPNNIFQPFGIRRCRCSPQNHTNTQTHTLTHTTCGNSLAKQYHIDWMKEKEWGEMLWSGERTKTTFSTKAKVSGVCFLALHTNSHQHTFIRSISHWPFAHHAYISNKKVNTWHFIQTYHIQTTVNIPLRRWINESHINTIYLM